MKHIFYCITLAFFSTTIVAQPLQKLWSTETIFKVPESVLFDAEEKVLFVSNIDGASGAKDNKGHISKLGTDGKIVTLEWATGLHAPKGMAVYGKILFVADVDAIVAIEKSTGKIIKRTEVPGAKFLNDLTVDEIGTLYFSDSETGIIHKMEPNKLPETFISALTRPNGVNFYNGKLYYLDAGALYVRDNKGTITEIAKGMERSTDGLEPIDTDFFLVSAWVGEIYLVKMDGSVKILLSTKDQKINSADIGYDPSTRIMYVPTFSDNKVIAYKVVL